MQTATFSIEEYMKNHSALVEASKAKSAVCELAIESANDALQSLDTTTFDNAIAAANMALDSIEDNYTDWTRCYCEIQGLLSRASYAPFDS